MASRNTLWGRVGCAVALALCCSCSKPRANKTEGTAKPSAVASAAPVPASSAAIGVTKELEHLIELSKSQLTPEQKRERLRTALEKFPKDHSKEREELLLGAVAKGALDPIQWTTITSNYRGRRAEIQVTTDALTILGVRFDLTAEGAQRIADELHAILPTPRILQLIWEQADVRLQPCTLPADAQMASTARMIQHSACVDERIAGRKGMVANEGKHWVLTNRIAGNKNLAANYGWFVKGRRPIQTVGTAHDTAHTDYSQIVRLVKPIVKVDGREIDIRHVGRSPELWGLVSDEGPLLVWRASRPGAAPTRSETSVAVAKAPAPGDPKAVRLALKPGMMPVGVEQLPETTTGLRRNKFLRRVYSALRMREEDVPEEAFWSAGAAACGGRDLFFELANEVPIDHDELRQSREAIQAALACGKALAPSLRAGMGLLQVEYQYEGAPSGLALLTLADASFRDKLTYPPLSPTPAGVHRAYCNDDEGGPRSVCQDGARSRLILAVNDGYVAAYAREVPSLLERLTQSRPPSAKLAELAAFFGEQPEDEVAVSEGGSCAFAMDFTALELSPDETSRQRVLDAINDNTVLCGTARWGSVLDLSRRLVFVAKDETAAQVIAGALKRRVAEARAETGLSLPNRAEQTEFDKGLRSAAMRAAREAKPEIQGRRLSVTLTLKPNEAEKRGMAGLLDARKAKAARAARIVHGLAEGRLPPAAELQAFLGPASVDNH